MDKCLCIGKEALKYLVGGQSMKGRGDHKGIEGAVTREDTLEPFRVGQTLQCWDSADMTYL